MPTIGICSKNFGISEAFALYLIQCDEQFQHYRVINVEGLSIGQNCAILIGVGQNCNLERMHFVVDADKDKFEDHTMEKLHGYDRYDKPLSTGGLVYAKIGKKLLKLKGLNRIERDFRKIYEYFVEVLDAFTMGYDLEYLTSEKTELYAFLVDLSNSMQDKNRDNFLAFAEETSHEIGERFELTVNWYRQHYLPAFSALITAIQKNEKGLTFCDYDFSEVSFNDLLARAATTQRLPRLIIRPIKSKYRLEAVKLVKPTLIFPKEWIGKRAHIYKEIGLDNIDYISSGHDFAIAQTLEAAMELARKLLKYAEGRPELIVTSQEQPNYQKAGDGRPFLSLHTSRDNSQEESIGKRQLTDEKEKTEINKQHKNNNNIFAWDVVDEKLYINFNSSSTAQIPLQQVEITKEERENMGMANTNTNTTAEHSAADDDSQAEGTSSSGSNSSPRPDCQHFPIVIEQSPTSIKNPSKSVFLIAPTENGLSGRFPGLNLSNFNFTNEGDDIGPQVEKVFRPICKNNSTVYMGIPDKNFAINHVFAAAIVGHALGSPDGTLRLQSLQKSNCLIRIGPDFYDFEDADHKFTSAQTVSLHSFDLSLSDHRLSLAGIGFVLHGRRAIAKIIAKGDPENLTQFLAHRNGMDKVAAIFRRTYKRLVQPMEEFVENNQFPLATAESTLFHRAMSGFISSANTGELNNEQGFNCFMTALYIAMDFFAKFILSQIE